MALVPTPSGLGSHCKRVGIPDTSFFVQEAAAERFMEGMCLCPSPCDCSMLTGFSTATLLPELAGPISLITLLRMPRGCRYYWFTNRLRTAVPNSTCTCAILVRAAWFEWKFPLASVLWSNARHCNMQYDCVRSSHGFVAIRIETGPIASGSPADRCMLWPWA